MQIFLPPSEGKTVPASGPRLDTTRLAFGGLDGPRMQVINSLQRICRDDPPAAMSALKLGVRQQNEVSLNASISHAPTAVAWRVYSGVLYQQCDIETMPEKVRDAAHRQLVIFSGLWGILRANDLIPAYRCGATAKLPDLDGARPSTVGTFWRKHLKTYVRDAIGDEFVLDLRSGPYVKMWQPSGAYATVQVLQERIVDGVTKRSVVSHFNKATKGRMVAEILAADAHPASMSEAVEMLRDLKYRVESDESAHRINIIVDEL